MEEDGRHIAMHGEPFDPHERAGVEEQSGQGKDDGHQEDDQGGSLGKALQPPRAPTRQDMEEHAVTHWPFRAWCDHCVRGKA